MLAAAGASASVGRRCHHQVPASIANVSAAATANTQFRRLELLAIRGWNLNSCSAPIAWAADWKRSPGSFASNRRQNSSTPASTPALAREGRAGSM